MSNPKIFAHGESVRREAMPRLKRGDILRNPYCPGDGNPTRVCVYLGKEKHHGSNHAVLYQDGTIGTYSSTSFMKYPPYEIIGHQDICIDTMHDLCEQTDKTSWEEYQRERGTNA